MKTCVITTCRVPSEMCDENTIVNCTQILVRNTLWMSMIKSKTNHVWESISQHCSDGHDDTIFIGYF